MKHELKKSVKNHVESQALSSEQYEELANLINSRQQKRSPQGFFNLKAISAAFFVVIASGLLWSFGVGNKVAVSHLIAEEVAYNHLKMKPLEVSSGSLIEVRSYFDKLDFSLKNSSFLASNNLQLMGGRYCSIQGKTAAQLHMKDENTGATQIVYQAPYNKEIFRDLPILQEGKAPVRHFVNGIAVDIWVEKGILFARSFDQ